MLHFGASDSTSEFDSESPQSHPFFRERYRYLPEDTETHDSQGGRGRVLVFSQIGLNTYPEDRGPHLELTAEEIASDTEAGDRIQAFVTERLSGPRQEGSLRVQFDCDVPYGWVRHADASWPSTSYLARFRVYTEGRTPADRAKEKKAQRLKAWSALAVTTAFLAVVAGWAAGPLGAVLALLCVSAFATTRYGR